MRCITFKENSVLPGILNYILSLQKLLDRFGFFSKATIDEEKFLLCKDPLRSPSTVGICRTAGVGDSSLLLLYHNVLFSPLPSAGVG